MRNASNFIPLKKQPVKKQQGFTMLEALLTLFVLTIGVLGVAGLQMRAMSSGGVAMQRTVAMMKTQEIIERMRVNRTNAAAYAVNTAVSAPITVASAGSAQSAVDLTTWQADIVALLPNPVTTTIGVAAGAGTTPSSTVVVTISWTDKSIPQSYVVQTSI